MTLLENREVLDRVAWAINQAWNEFGEVPFPLYQHEAERLAKAAIEALAVGERAGKEEK